MATRFGRRRFLGRTATAGLATGAVGALAASRALAGQVGPADQVAAPSQPAPKPAVTVLVYHSIPDRAGFATELDWLQSWNYSFITADALADWLEGRGELPPKALLLTFDDGYHSQFACAWPELEARGVAATIYACTGWIDGSVSQKEGDFREARPLTWSQLRTMRGSGLVSVQSHTVSHAPQTHLSPGQVRSEFLRSKERIEAMLPGERVSHLAYPFGAWNAEVRQALADAGCRSARTMTRPGPGYGFFSFAESDSDPLALPCAGGSFRDVLAANYFHTVVEGDELAPDYGFESGALGWTLGPGFSVAEVSYVKGRRALRAQAGGMPTSSSTTQLVPIVPGATVSGAVALLAERLSPGARVSVGLELLGADGLTVLGMPTVASIPGDAPTWVQRQWSQPTPAGCTYIRPFCLLDPAGGSTGYGYWDDLSLRAPTPDPRLAR